MNAPTKLMFCIPTVALSLSLFILPTATSSAETTGESLFEASCSSCHPGGDNIMNRKKTLHKADREANKIYTAEDIVDKMRNPGPAPTHPQDWAGMKMFDKDKISDDDALKIAHYILKTFN